jgi:hypothetical protein
MLTPFAENDIDKGNQICNYPELDMMIDAIGSMTDIDGS